MKKDISDLYVCHGKRTASRIWGRVGVVLLMPRGVNNKDKEEAFVLNGISVYIWKILEKKPQLREVALKIAKKKRISYGLAIREVKRYLKDLSRKKIVDIVDKR